MTAAEVVQAILEESEGRLTLPFNVGIEGQGMCERYRVDGYLDELVLWADPPAKASPTPEECPSPEAGILARLAGMMRAVEEWEKEHMTAGQLRASANHWQKQCVSFSRQLDDARAELRQVRDLNRALIEERDMWRGRWIGAFPESEEAKDASD